jgi:hypothetical protein
MADDDFDPELDLLERYERMTRTQIETLNGIDDKAARIARLVALLAGLILTSVSVVARTEGFRVDLTGGASLLFAGFAVSSLFVSLVYAIITYLSSEFEYGPTADIGRYMSKYRVPDQEYKDVLLRGYSSAIEDNRRVVVANARRFQRCLASFASGLLFFFGVGVLLVAPNDLYVQIPISLVFLGLVFALAHYILREEYLTLDRQ